MEAEEFYNAVKIARLPRNLTYHDFAGRFSSVKNNPRLLLKGYLYHQKESYHEKQMNMVNYVATVVEGMGIDKNDSGKGNAMCEALDNFSSIVVEKPIAEVTKREERRYGWEKITNKGKKEMKLKSQFGYFDEILEESLHSSQPADFEYERYQANLENYKKLRNARERGDYRTFVEFSPSPVLTNEARKRGYFGMDTIFFYRFDGKSGEEVIEQRWLKTSKKNFTNLISELSHEQYMYLSDGALMRKSRIVNQDEEERVNGFIDSNNGEFINRPELKEYQEKELRDKIRNMVQPILEIAAQKMLVGIPFERELDQLEAAGAYLQYLLREKIKDLSGIDKTRITISPEIRNKLETDRVFLAQFVEENKKKMPLGGCGGSNEKESNGMSRGMTDILKDEHGSLVFEEPCPFCNSRHRRKRGELLTECPYTGKKYDKACS